jgi:hypothetical protein
LLRHSLNVWRVGTSRALDVRGSWSGAKFTKLADRALNHEAVRAGGTSSTSETLGARQAVVNVVDVDSVVVGAGGAWVLGLGGGSGGAVVAQGTVETEVVSHGLVGAVVLGWAQLDTVEGVDTLKWVVVADGGRSWVG